MNLAVYEIANNVLDCYFQRKYIDVIGKNFEMTLANEIAAITTASIVCWPPAVR